MYVVVVKLTDPQIQPGWTSLIATVLLIGGIQMFFLGIIGEYVGRIYMRLNRYPQFVIAKTTFDLKQDIVHEMGVSSLRVAIVILHPGDVMLWSYN